MWNARKDGQETAYWGAGPFKVRLPFWHYRFEWPDYFQGLAMCAVDLAAIPLLTLNLGMPFDVALAIVVLNGLLYLTHHLLGDPVVPGWITPAIPLLVSYCKTFPEGPERMHALIAFQMSLGLLAVVLGATGLSRRIVGLVPPAIKSGVIMGAGFLAVTSIFVERTKGGGTLPSRFDLFPWTITLAVGIAFYMIFSRQFQCLKQGNRGWAGIGKLGILPVILLALVVAPLTGEAALPQIEWRLSQPDFGTLFREYTLLGLGLPPLTMFVQGVPTVLATYIVLFGDVLQSKALLAEADSARPDERVDYNEDRAHLIFGGRNLAMSVLGPDLTMCGPLWAAMHVVILERFKEGKRAMHSVFGGSGSFRFGTNTGLLLMPIVSLVRPVLDVALALTLLIQGYVSVRIGVLEARSQRDLGIAGVVAGVLAVEGAAMAFGAGVLLCLLIYGRAFFTGEADGTFRHTERDGLAPPRHPAGSQTSDRTHVP